MNIFRLKSSDSETVIQFTDRQGEYFRVLQGRDHSAVRDVYATTDAEGLARLFSEAARDWKGWKEPKTWESLEGELSINLTHDGKGSITLKIVINADFGGPDPWRHKGELTLDAGQLESIAGDARHFWKADKQIGVAAHPWVHLI